MNSAAMIEGVHSKYSREPTFQYRPLNIDPARYKGQLYRIDMDRVEDSTLGALFRSKRIELDRQLTMLMERGTLNYLYGMFLAGLDIVGNKLMEINVFSPGGLGSARIFEKVNFCTTVLEAIERKVHYMTFYDRHFNNTGMACL